MGRVDGSHGQDHAECPTGSEAQRTAGDAGLVAPRGGRLAPGQGDRCHIRDVHQADFVGHGRRGGGRGGFGGARHHQAVDVEAPAPRLGVPAGAAGGDLGPELIGCGEDPAAGAHRGPGESRPHRDVSDVGGQRPHVQGGAGGGRREARPFRGNALTRRR